MKAGRDRGRPATIGRINKMFWIYPLIAVGFAGIIFMMDYYANWLERNSAKRHDELVKFLARQFDAL